MSGGHSANERENDDDGDYFLGVVKFGSRLGGFVMLSSFCKFIALRTYLGII